MTIEIPFEASAVMAPMADMIAEVKREIALRNAVYPKFIASGRMKPAAAAQHVHRMECVLRFLQFCSEGGARE